MPTFAGDDGTPIVVFNPGLEVSPFTLFKRLQRERPPLLADVRPEPGIRTLRGAVSASPADWRPPDRDTEVVLFDDDGSLALTRAESLRKAGYERVKVLFGGLDLYEFSLDPRVVGRETFLEIADDDPESSSSTR